MPSYDFRCKNCGEEFSQFYKSIAAYDAATTTCPNCKATELSRVIDRVQIQQPTRDYTRMNADEMLSVLESGDKSQVDEMYKQVGAGTPQDASSLHEQVKKATPKPPKNDDQ